MKKHTLSFKRIEFHCQSKIVDIPAIDNFNRDKFFEHILLPNEYDVSTTSELAPFWIFTKIIRKHSVCADASGVFIAGIMLNDERVKGRRYKLRGAIE